MKNNFIVQEDVLFLYFLRISSLRKTGKQNLDVAFPDYRLLFKFKKMFWGTCPHPNGHDSYFVPSVRGDKLDKDKLDKDKLDKDKLDKLDNSR